LLTAYGGGVVACRRWCWRCFAVCAVVVWYFDAWVLKCLNSFGLDFGGLDWNEKGRTVILKNW